MCPLKRRFSFLTSSPTPTQESSSDAMITMDPPALLPHVSDTSTTSTSTASSLSSLETTGHDYQDFFALSPNYRPSKMDIVCGRGRGYYGCPGNVYFRQVVQDHLNLYLEQRSKVAKTAVLSDIVDYIHQQQPQTKFVKQLGCGKWFQLSEALARDKVGNAMREAMSARNKQKHAAKQQRGSFSWNPLAKKQRTQGASQSRASPTAKNNSKTRKCLLEDDDDSDLYWIRQEQIAREAQQRQQQEQELAKRRAMPPPQKTSFSITPVSSFSPAPVGSSFDQQGDMVFGKHVQLLSASQEFHLEQDPSKKMELRRSSLLSLASIPGLGLLDDAPSLPVPTMAGSSSGNAHQPMELAMESSSAEFLLKCCN